MVSNIEYGNIWNNYKIIFDSSDTFKNCVYSNEFFIKLYLIIINIKPANHFNFGFILSEYL